jgi:hypothetical protein
MDLPDFALRPAPDRKGPVPVSVLDITCEGLWLLQALCGVETLPVLLALRPYAAAAGAPVGHPGIAILREAGALLDDQTVHPRIAEWIDVLGAPDVELCASIRRSDEHLRLAVARRDGLHVAASRYNDDLTIEELGHVGSVRELVSRILPLCGPAVAAAGFEPIAMPSLRLIDGLDQVVGGEHSPAAALAGLGLSAEQRNVLILAADKPVMEMSLGVVQHDSRGQHVAQAAMAVTDTTVGRIVTGPMRGEDGTWWTRISPGTNDAVARALRSLVDTLPTPSWREHSRLN